MNAQLTFPTARTTDPTTSRAAAERVAPGNSDLVNAIRLACCGAEPLTQFEIAQTVMHHHPRRWTEGTIRTGCKRAGLIAVDCEGISPNSKPGREIHVLRFTLGAMP